jgi:tetratricopeptide (TPR) repeat protein
MRFTTIQPSDDEIRVILETGFLLREANRFKEAESVFSGAIEIIPNSDVPRVGLATVKLQSGNYELAQSICEEALKIKPNSLYAKVHRAEAMLFQKKRDEAIEEFENIIETDADSPHSRTAKAYLDIVDLVSPE